jgi:hypothetical protein
MTRRTDFNDEHFCLDPDDSKAVTCILNEDADRSLSFGSFSANDIRVRWVPAPDGMVLEKITIVSQPIDDCGEMSRAFQSATGLITAKYPSLKLKKGRLHGSKRCKHHMDEGNVYVSLADGNFEIRIDTYWYEGSYRVFISYTLLPALEQAHLLRARKELENATDAMGKL